eukprot:UN21613
MLWMKGGLFLRFSLTSTFRGLQIEVVYEVKDSHAQNLCAQKAIEIAKVCGYIFSKKKMMLSISSITEIAKVSTI